MKLKLKFLDDFIEISRINHFASSYYMLRYLKYVTSLFLSSKVRI